MIKMKKYSISLLLVYTIHSFSMDIAANLKDKVALISTRIDHEILSVDEKPWFIPAIGCCLNLYSTSFSTIQKSKALQELEKIDLMIRTNKNDIVKKLYEEHHYFARLIHVMVQDEVEQLKNVTSITLDTLCNTQAKIPRFSDEMSSLVHEKAHKIYHENLDDRYPYQRPLDRKYYLLDEEEIHVMPLKKGNYAPCRLAICDRGKYLKAFNTFDEVVMWDIETGEEVKEIPSDVLTTRNNSCDKKNNHKMINDNLMVTCGYTEYPYGYETICEYYKKHKFVPAMVIIRPTVISWLCQQVFLKSVENATALTKLRDSQAVAHLQGIPKIMLLKFIRAALTKLEKAKQED